MTPLRIAVIGAGTHGARYMKHIVEDTDGMVLTACSRRHPEAVAETAARWNCRPHTDAHEAILSPDVDALIIVTPPSTHHELATAALDSGKAVLLEKPATGTLAEARDLAERAQRPGAPTLMIAQTLRWNPVLLRARELWSSLGTVRHLRIAQRLEPTVLPWQSEASQTIGGSVLLTGVHLFDTVRFLTGCEFVAVDARQERFHNPAVEDFFLARARLDDDTWVSLEVSKYGAFRGCQLEAVGDKGQLLAEYYFGGLKVNRGRETQIEDIDAMAPTLPAVLADWRDAVLNKSTPPVTITDGVRTMEMVEACYMSHRSGRPINIGSL